MSSPQRKVEYLLGLLTLMVVGQGEGPQEITPHEKGILERGIRADLSIIKGWKADEAGNLLFRKTARNFNQPAATCGKICVAEVEEIVPVGSLDPDCDPFAEYLCETAHPWRAL